MLPAPAAARILSAPPANRRICSWCGGDLGALTHQSQHPSYGICESCAHRHFGYLYEPEAPPPGAATARQPGCD